MIVSTEFNGDPLAMVLLGKTKKVKEFCAGMLSIQGVHSLYFRYEGIGAFDFHGFELL